MKNVKRAFIICVNVLIVTIFTIPSIVYAQRGCCSWHDGVSGGCTSEGRVICNDGTTSPSCRCTPSDNNENESENNSIGIFSILALAGVGGTIYLNKNQKKLKR